MLITYITYIFEWNDDHQTIHRKSATKMNNIFLTKSIYVEAVRRFV
jgi:hypothetical protein